MEQSKNSEFLNETELWQMAPENHSWTESNQTDDYDYNYNWETFVIFDLLPQSYRNARIFLYRYFVVIIWIISVLGNSLVIVVLTRKRNRHFSTSVYLTGLAVADLSLNTSNSLLLYFRAHGHIKNPASTDDCRYRNVFSFAIEFVATWMLVVISIERVISVLLPYKVKQVCTTKVAYIIVAFTWIFFFGLAFLHQSLMEYYSFFGCQFKKGIGPIYANYISWCLVAMKFWIPFAIILSCSIVIVITLLKTRQIRKQSTQIRKQTSVNLAMLSVNLVFLMTHFPYSFFYSFADYTSLASNNLLSHAYYLFWYQTLQALGDSNSAFNVFVYFLVGSRFRYDVKELFSNCIPRKVTLTSDGIKKQTTLERMNSAVATDDHGSVSTQRHALRRHDSQFRI